jgi:hypothetical protein
MTGIGKLYRMNERKEFLQYFFRSVFTKMVGQLDTMTETQALDGLRELNAARSIYEEEIAERMKMIQTQVGEQPGIVNVGRNTAEELAYLSSLEPFLNSVNSLRSLLGAKARSGGRPPSLFNSLEDALKNRLETLRKKAE